MGTGLHADRLLKGMMPPALSPGSLDGEAVGGAHGNVSVVVRALWVVSCLAVLAGVGLDAPRAFAQGDQVYVDQAYTGEVEDGSAAHPFRAFKAGAHSVARGGTVLIAPGRYAAVGTYTKPMTLQAPSGGVVLGPAQTVNSQANRCDDFFVNFFIIPPVPPLLPLSLLLPHFSKDTPDPAWVLVRRSDPALLFGQSGVPLPKFRSASGVVTLSEVSYKDYPDVHDSHDFTFDLRLDTLRPDGLPILSEAGKDRDGDGTPDTLHLEWETGILTNEFTGDGSAHFFPKWAWPSVGDRVWANGYWIFDCGHPFESGAPRKTEIHPIRAIATMRPQVATPPGGTAPMRVTATDLYIHGRAGVATDLLECGGGVLLDDRACPTPSGETPRGCDISSPFADFYPCHDPVTDHLGIPIDENFEFDICTPAQPDGVVLTTWVDPGPGNTVTDPARAPILELVPVGDRGEDPCARTEFGLEFGPQKVHVTIPLAESGVTPDDVYARRIYVGWVDRPVNLRHFRVTLNKMILNIDHDDNPIIGANDCECTFFWMNVDRAPNEWIRLSDFAMGNMNDFGSGEEIGFRAGAFFDFFVPDGEPFIIRANGWDGGVGEGALDPKQDCLDDHFGHHDFREHVRLNLDTVPPSIDVPDPCIAALKFFESDADNDRFKDLRVTFGPDNGYGVGQQTLSSEPRCFAHGSFPASPLFSRLEIPCDPAQQQEALEALARAGFTLTEVVEVPEYQFVVTIRELPVDSDEGVCGCENSGLGNVCVVHVNACSAGFTPRCNPTQGADGAGCGGCTCQ